MPGNRKIKIKLKAAPPKIRRIWRMKPVARVKPADRKARLDRLRDREMRDDA